MTKTHRRGLPARTTTFRAVALAALLPLLAGAAWALESDVPGSSDHPHFPRLPFAFIAHYQQADPGEYQLILGPLPSDDAAPSDVAKTQTLAGKVTRIQYSIVSPQSVADAFYQYDYRLEQSRFETLVETKGPATRAPGGSLWLSKVYAPLGKEAVEGLVTTAVASQRRYWAGRLARPDGDLYIAMTYNQHTPGEVRVQVDIIEVK